MFRVLNAVIDRITGFDIDNELARVLDMDSWTRLQIERYQSERFEILKRYATGCEIYSGYQDKHLQDFPSYSREFYKRNYEKFKTKLRKPYCIIPTSGSTTTPLNVVVSKEMLLAKRVSHQKMLSWYGLKREDRELKMGGYRMGLLKKSIKSFYWTLRNKRHWDSFYIASSNPGKLLSSYYSYRPIG